MNPACWKGATHSPNDMLAKFSVRATGIHQRNPDFHELFMSLQHPEDPVFPGVPGDSSVTHLIVGGVIATFP